MSSKREKWVFSGHEGDFWSEQFEARIYSLKLGKALSGDVTYLGYMQAVRNNSL